MVEGKISGRTEKLEEDKCKGGELGGKKVKRYIFQDLNSTINRILY